MVASVAYWSLFILFSSFWETGNPVEKYTSRSYYDIIRNNKVIGYMLCSKVSTNETVEYINESSARFSMLISVSVYSKLHSSFNKGILHDGKLLRVVNGKTKSNKRIEWNEDQYVIDNDGRQGSFRSRINFTTACLMYTEPQGMKYIFSENFGCNVAIEEIASHKYVLRLPDGDNFYTYRDGKCVEVEVRTTLATVYIKPRK